MLHRFPTRAASTSLTPFGKPSRTDQPYRGWLESGLEERNILGAVTRRYDASSLATLGDDGLDACLPREVQDTVGWGAKCFP